MAFQVDYQARTYWSRDWRLGAAMINSSHLIGVAKLRLAHTTLRINSVLVYPGRNMID